MEHFAKKYLRRCEALTQVTEIHWNSSKIIMNVKPKLEVQSDSVRATVFA